MERATMTDATIETLKNLAFVPIAFVLALQIIGRGGKSPNRETKNIVCLHPDSDTEHYPIIIILNDGSTQNGAYWVCSNCNSVGLHNYFENMDPQWFDVFRELWISRGYTVAPPPER